MYSVSISVAIPLKSGNIHVFCALLCATAVHGTIGVVLKYSFFFLFLCRKTVIIATKHIFIAIVV